MMKIIKMKNSITRMRKSLKTITLGKMKSDEEVSKNMVAIMAKMISP